MTIITIVSLVLAVAATVLAFIFVVPNKKRHGFLKILHDTLTFKFLIVEKILQALYIFTTGYVFTLGFCLLFYAPQTYSFWYGGGGRTWYGGYGILIMLFGPIIVRLVYEFIMMFILLIKNVIQINNKLKNQNEGNSGGDIFATPSIPVVKKPKAPASNFCRNCGTRVSSEEAFCPGCGMRIK